MNRRRFLAWLTGTAAGVAAAGTLDVDQLLWTPGARTIFLPPTLPLHEFKMGGPLRRGETLMVGDKFTIGETVEEFIVTAVHTYSDALFGERSIITAAGAHDFVWVRQ